MLSPLIFVTGVSFLVYDEYRVIFLNILDNDPSCDRFAHRGKLKNILATKVAVNVANLLTRVQLGLRLQNNHPLTFEIKNCHRSHSVVYNLHKC